MALKERLWALDEFSSCWTICRHEEAGACVSCGDRSLGTGLDRATALASQSIAGFAHPPE